MCYKARPFVTSISLCVLGAYLFSVGAARSQETDPYARFLAQTDPLSPQAQLEKFHVPDGFRVELVAAEPHVRKPINLAFDASGRLLITGSVEYPHPAKPGRAPLDEIKVLFDADRDGVFDLTETRSFASGLNIPVGITSVPGGVISYSIPTIDRFVDSNGDGRADRRETLVRGFGHQDTHGMASSLTAWIDGWIYACHGEGNESTLVGSDGQPLTLRGGCTFRMQPDGSHLEIFTHGQANPFGLCVDPRGDVYAADSHSKPATLLLRHAWYPGLGSEHDGLGFGPPIMQHYHGSTGIAGIAYYADDKFPASYRDSIFLGNPVTGRINHDRLTFHGSTCEAVEQPDFLVCDDPWFRPVDVKLGPDGALYIADFYDRVIGHTVVPSGHEKRDRERGRIWRVVWVDESSSKTLANRSPPDLAAVELDELLKALGHSNLTIRTLTTHQIVERIGQTAIVPLRQLVSSSAPDDSRVHALWALQRLGGLDRELRRKLANDPDPRIRLQLTKILADTGDWTRDNSDARPIVLVKLVDSDPFVQRAAVDAMGRHPHAGSVEENLDRLLSLWSKVPREDSMLSHTVRMAVRDVVQSSGDELALAGPYRNRAEDLRRIADVSLGIRTPSSAQYVLQHLQQGEFEPRRFSELLRHTVKYLEPISFPELYALARSYHEKDAGQQRRMLSTLFAGVRQRRMKLPDDLRSWAVDDARKLLSSDDESQVHVGIELAWEAELGEVAGELVRLAQPSSPFPDLRSYAMDALTSASPARAIGLLDGFLSKSDETVDFKERAAESLARIQGDASGEILVRHLPTAPARVALAISRSLAHRRDGGERLLKAIAEGKASPRLIQDLVVDQALRALDLPELDTRLEELRAGLVPEESSIAQRIAERRQGFSAAAVDVEQGKQIFERHCAVCHQVRGKGQSVGPALDAIGARGMDRLLEDILDPSGTVDQKYRESIIETKSGQILVGLVVRADDQGIGLVNAEGKQLDIPADQVENRRQTTLSSMPQNVTDRIREADFYHVIGYLLSLKP